MTAHKNLKRLIRRRMRKTGESYTAARRHFLRSKESEMTKSTVPHEPCERLPIAHLQLTLKTALALKQHHIERIGQLIDKTETELAGIGLAAQSRIEIRDVLAARGL